MNTQTKRIGLLLVFFMLGANAAKAQAPMEWIYAGNLNRDGVPVTGSIDFTVELYDSAIDPVYLWSEAYPDTPVTDGSFTLQLGSAGEPIHPSILTGGILWIRVLVDGESLGPRQPVASVPYAHRAARAAETISSSGISVAETEVVDAEGSWTGSTLAADSVSLPFDLDAFNEALDSLETLDSRISTLETAMIATEATLFEQVSTLDGIFLDLVELQDRLMHVRRDGDALIVAGANLHVRSGGGSTYHSATLDSVGEPNGLGNVIIGYDEADGRDRDGGSVLSGATNGSHNLVVGPGQAYPGFASIAAGRGNRLAGVDADTYQVVEGNLAVGTLNQTASPYTVIISGTGNSTEELWTTVFGGSANRTTDDWAVTVGGSSNQSDARLGVTVGGFSNVTMGVPLPSSPPLRSRLVRLLPKRVHRAACSSSG